MTIFNNRESADERLQETPCPKNEVSPAPVSQKGVGLKGGCGQAHPIDNESKVTATISSLLAIEPLKKFFRGK